VRVYKEIEMLLVLVVNIRNGENKKSGTLQQARRQDIAARGAKNLKVGHIVKILYWKYAATRGPNAKWGAGHHWPPRWRRSYSANTGN